MTTNDDEQAEAQDASVTPEPQDMSELHPLSDGEHAVLTGSAETTAAMREAPRTGPRFCWAGGVPAEHVEAVRCAADTVVADVTRRMGLPPEMAPTFKPGGEAGDEPDPLESMDAAALECAAAVALIGRAS